MKLHSLRLQGFKSFADATEVRFHDGITAVVGPNGCGKSNISDAIRWVLGEQRPSAIRGTRMEEAIFQGTVKRRPVNRGSVTMVVSNEDGALPVPYEEVEISRVVYRDGGSEYFINRGSCRLKDVQDLCRDTGLGANAYAVIESRMIDAILSNRADERRSLFEEAAGIGRYKDRRKGASTRLERAEADLQRLEDLISEVETKVRSLARQKGRAERYGEFRARRMALEVTLASRQLKELEARHGELRAELPEEGQGDEELSAAVSTAEAEHQSLLARQTEAEEERTRVASALDEVRQELSDWERELAVARERSEQGQDRLERLKRERTELGERLESLDGQREEAEGRQTELQEEAEGLRTRLEEASEEVARRREAHQSVRGELEDLERREREATRKAAQLDAEAEAARNRQEELRLQHERLAAELEEARDALTELDEQGDLFTGRVEGLEEAVSDAEAALEDARAALEESEEALEAARETESSARDEVSELEARAGALERMEEAREGLDPVVKEALQRPGVEGVLTDFLEVPTHLAGAVEAYLGDRSRALVVQDTAAADAVRQWFLEEWEGGGGLILLPLDRVPSEDDGGGTLLEALEPQGAGAPWARHLLSGVDLVEEGSGPTRLEERTDDADGRDLLGAAGWVMDRTGALRLGNPAGTTGALERQEALRELQERLTSSRQKAEEAAHAHQAAREVRDEARSRVDASEAQLRQSQDDLRELRSEADAREERRTHLARRVEDLERQVGGMDVALQRAREQESSATESRSELASAEEGLQGEREALATRVEEAEAHLEEARSRASSLEVDATRAEGELERARERREGLARELEKSRTRLEELGREENTLVQEVEEARELQQGGEARLEELFALRDERQEELRKRSEVVEGLSEEVQAAGERLRKARQAERETTERRHQVELEVRDVEGRMARIRERLEAEWGRPLQELAHEVEEPDGSDDELEAELQEVRGKLEKLGPVNMLAVEEHEEESQRLEFLRGQREDLVTARDNLRSAIQEINRTATTRFNETFQAIRENFRSTFLRLFEGGECDLWLEDPDNPLESPIEVQASPVGKRTQSIDLLSGGERSLTALSLLFGIYLVKPSPFCVLDEVDAPLDESNIGRFIRLLNEFKGQTQFVVVTHNPRTIEAADWIYGVTMEEPGVSSVVGVQLEEALEVSGTAA